MNKNDKLRVVNGLAVGAVNGLFGGGGGMVAVPLLEKSLGYTRKQAHATAIYIIAPVCLTGSFVYIFNGFAKLNLIIPVSLGSIIGGIVGAIILKKLPPKIVDIIFIIIMLAAGIKMLL
jgi:hypothetical protein